MNQTKEEKQIIKHTMLWMVIRAKMYAICQIRISILCNDWSNQTQKLNNMNSSIMTSIDVMFLPDYDNSISRINIGIYQQNKFSIESFWSPFQNRFSMSMVIWVFGFIFVMLKMLCFCGCAHQWNSFRNTYIITWKLYSTIF